jgi:POT family proton-dependent oligopeptide transporter
LFAGRQEDPALDRRDSRLSARKGKPVLMSTQNNSRRHPPALPFLFFTEMWERFGFYLMLGIFFLYMTAEKKPNPFGGLGMSTREAADVMGTYMALVYLAPFLGGLLADRYLGYRVSIFIGGTLMGAGYLLLALPGEGPFWAALSLIILGNGFFKPNISTLLGNLYSEEPYKPYKDAGYNIFYMGINIGAFICNFVAAYLRNQYGWGYAFAAAGIGMFIGLAIFLVGQKYTQTADVLKPPRPEDMPMTAIVGTVFVPAVLFGLAGWFLPQRILPFLARIVPMLSSQTTFFGSQSSDAFLWACVPVVVFYVSLWWRASHEDRQGIGAMLAIFGVVVVFWAIFNQAGSALTLWAEKFTSRAMPEALVPVAKPVGMIEEVSGEEEVRPRLDDRFRPVKGKDGKPIMEKGPDPYLLNLPKEEWPKGDEKLNLVSTEIFQSINPFFVVVLTPVVVALFNWLKKRGAEPSTPAKIGYGLIISALSSLVMVGAVYATHNYQEKSPAWWLVAAYGVMTVGELCLSPMGLSLVSKLSPARLTALMMGGWFLSTAIGGKLSGMLASMWDSYDNKVNFFLVNCACSSVAGIAIFVMLPWLRRVVKQKTGSD